MELHYPQTTTNIEDMCTILEHFRIPVEEYTDCTILYTVTFEQLRTLYNLGKEHGQTNTRTLL